MHTKHSSLAKYSTVVTTSTNATPTVKHSQTAADRSGSCVNSEVLNRCPSGATTLTWPAWVHHTCHTPCTTHDHTITQTSAAPTLPLHLSNSSRVQHDSLRLQLIQQLHNLLLLPLLLALEGIRHKAVKVWLSCTGYQHAADASSTAHPQHIFVGTEAEGLDAA